MPAPYARKTHAVAVPRSAPTGSTPPDTTPGRRSARKLPICGVVITRNEADRIARCVTSMATVCRHVIVLDSNSDDATVSVATAAGARVERQRWLGFAAQKNAAIARATQPWVLLLDADEWLAEGADDQIRALFSSGRVEDADVWRFSRRTHFLGTTLDHGHWSNEQVGRLFRSDMRYLPLLVHEHLDLTDKRVARIDARIEHNTARSQPQYASKLKRYSRLWAQQRIENGRRAYILSAPIHAAAYWLKACLLHGGFLDGPMAWRYHAMHTRYVYDKYRLLYRSSSTG